MSPATASRALAKEASPDSVPITSIFICCTGRPASAISATSCAVSKSCTRAGKSGHGAGRTSKSATWKNCSSCRKATAARSIKCLTVSTIAPSNRPFSVVRAARHADHGLFAARRSRREPAAQLDAGAHCRRAWLLAGRGGAGVDNAKRPRHFDSRIRLIGPRQGECGSTVARPHRAGPPSARRCVSTAWPLNAVIRFNSELAPLIRVGFADKNDDNRRIDRDWYSVVRPSKTMLPIQENCADERKYRRQEGTALPTHMNHYARTPLPA